jgi:hypothetical protein
MPDWTKLVRRRTRSLALSPCAKEQVINEISGHLNEAYENARRAGVSEKASLRLALQEVGDWSVLIEGIRHTKSEDSSMFRTRALLVPTFVNLVLSSALINICDRLGMLDARLERMAQIPRAFQPWLLALPICGATAAFLARRSHGSPTVRVVAAVAPCIAWLTTLFVLKIILITFSGTFASIPSGTLAAASIGWGVLPALAMLVGALPFLGPGTLPQLRENQD